MFKVGDEIRVLVDGADHAPVSKGDEFYINKVFREDCAVEVDGGYHWLFHFDNIELVTDNK